MKHQYLGLLNVLSRVGYQKELIFKSANILNLTDMIIFHSLKKIRKLTLFIDHSLFNMCWLLKVPFLIAILLQRKLFCDVFQQLFKCLVFPEVLEPGELIQVAGYVFIQGTSHPL